MAWDKTKPANDELLINFPAQMRANLEALELGTDLALLITNAKISPTAGIVDTKLAQIVTPAKVSGAAITLLTSLPAGAGVIPDANSPHKLKADAGDTTPQYLDSLIDTNSFQISAGDLLQLKNDAAAPGNSKYYGTNAGGVKGYNALPEGISDHGLLSGLGDDDHNQYQTAARHAAVSHTAGMIGSSAISQSKLKTTTGAISSACAAYAYYTLPGGQYGFYPQSKVSAAHTCHRTIGTFGGRDVQFTQTSYNTSMFLEPYNCGGKTVYVQQRYVTSSGKDFWIFLLVAKKAYESIREWGKVERQKGEIVAGYEAPDHPSYGNGGDENNIPHPFISGYDSNKHEIVLVDNEILAKLKSKITSKRDLLTIINEDYEPDLESNPVYKPREIIEIDEYGDKKGEIIEKIKTPEWAKIVIGKDEIYLKKRIVKSLPNYIKYKKLKLKEG